MANFGLLAGEIRWRVWGTPANFNRFRVLAALLLHDSLVVGVSQTLRRWTEGATYILQGGHHFGHWPTFLVCFAVGLLFRLSCVRSGRNGQERRGVEREHHETVADPGSDHAHNPGAAKRR